MDASIGFAKKLLQGFLYIVPLIAWEIFKDRAASWANKKIDENAKDNMEALAILLKPIATAPVYWSICIAIFILLVLFIHSYREELKQRKQIENNRLLGKKTYRQRRDTLELEEVSSHKQQVNSEEVVEKVKEPRKQEQGFTAISVINTGKVDLGDITYVGAGKMLNVDNCGDVKVTRGTHIDPSSMKDKDKE